MLPDSIYTCMLYTNLFQKPNNVQLYVIYRAITLSLTQFREKHKSGEPSNISYSCQLQLYHLQSDLF